MNATNQAPQRATAIYTRLTREESLKTGLSAPAQKHDGEFYAKSRGLLPTVLYAEPKAVGGEVPFLRRKEGKRLIEDICAGKISNVVARALDRYARDVPEWLSFIEICETHDVTIHTFAGPVPLSTGSDQFASVVQMAAAQLEKRQTGERGQRAKHQLARIGRHMGGPPPYGYTSQSYRFNILKKAGIDEEKAKTLSEEECPKIKHLYIDNNEAKCVRLIFKMYVQRRLGCRTIANRLNRLGYTRRSGRPWHPDKVRRIINDPVLAGFIPYDVKWHSTRKGHRNPKCEQHRYEGKHPPIISHEVWEQGQTIKKQHTLIDQRKGNAGVANRRYDLSCVIKCGCGSKMKAASTQRGTNKGYYTCRNRLYYGPDAIGGCNRPRISIEKTDQAFWQNLGQLFQAPALSERVFEAAQRIVKERGKNDTDEHDPTVQADRLDKQIAAWYERHDCCSTQVEKDAAWHRILELTNRRNKLETLITSTPPKTGEASLLTLTLEAVSNHLAGIASAISLPKDSRKQIVQLLVEKHGLEVTVVDKEHITLRLGVRPPGAAKDESIDHVVQVEAIAELPPEQIDAWLKAHQGTCICKECEKIIPIVRHHYWRGLPKYHQGCWLSINNKRRVRPSARYYNGRQAAELLGIGRTTLGRWIGRGLLSVAKRQHGVLLFLKTAIDALIRAGSRKAV